MNDQLPTINKMVDISKLIKYTKKLNDIGSISKMMAPVYISDFIQAIDVTSSMLAAAVKEDLEAKAALETAEAIAYLDKAQAYLESKGVKDSSEARKRFVDIDEDVMRCKNDKARTEALVCFLKGKLKNFQNAHDSLKKICYGDQQMTSWEGM
jgi:hypothetical protein